MTTLTSPNERVLTRPQFVTLLASIMALNALAIGVLLPGLPMMGADLGIGSQNEQQYAIGAYMLGMGIGTLFFGPISDRFGRRAPLFVGLGIYIVTALAAAFSPDFATLLVLRFAQGIGAASARVISQASVRDNFSGRDMAQVMSLVFMVFMVVPVLAPSIGQAILLVAPWQGILVFSAVLAIVIGTFAWLWLPESLPPERRRPLSIRSIAGGFGAVFSNRLAMGYSIAGTMMFGAMFGFVNSSQQIYVTTFGLGGLFALAFMLHGFSMAIANFLNSRIVPRIGMRRIAHTALLTYTALGGALLAISLLVDTPLWLWLSMIAVIMFCFGLCGSNMNSMAMEPLGKVAGTAASVFGFLQTTGGALIGTLIGQGYDGTVRPIAAGFFICGLGAVGMALFAERGRLFRPEIPHVPVVVLEPPE